MQENLHQDRQEIRDREEAARKEADILAMIQGLRADRVAVVIAIRAE
jgi:hypothetical protein